MRIAIEPGEVERKQTWISIVPYQSTPDRQPLNLRQLGPDWRCRDDVDGTKRELSSYCDRELYRKLLRLS